jgi:hypothetical protein
MSIGFGFFLLSAIVSSPLDDGVQKPRPGRMADLIVLVRNPPVAKSRQFGA